MSLLSLISITSWYFALLACGVKNGLRFEIFFLFHLELGGGAGLLPAKWLHLIMSPAGPKYAKIATPPPNAILTINQLSVNSLDIWWGFGEYTNESIRLPKRNTISEQTEHLPGSTLYHVTHIVKRLVSVPDFMMVIYKYANY